MTPTSIDVVEHVPLSRLESDGGRRFRREDAIDLAAIVGVVFLMIVTVRTTARLSHVLGLLVMAGVLPYLPLPLPHALARGLAHGLAVVLVPFLTFAAVVGIGLAVPRDITSQAERL